MIWLQFIGKTDCAARPIFLTPNAGVMGAGLSVSGFLNPVLANPNAT